MLAIGSHRGLVFLFILSLLMTDAPADGVSFNCVDRRTFATRASAFGNPPILAHARIQALMNAAGVYNVDPRLILAIAGWETGYGTVTTLRNGNSATGCKNNNNLFRWGNCSNVTFPDRSGDPIPNGLDRSISSLANFLRADQFVGKNNLSFDALSHAWCDHGQEDCANWVAGVKAEYSALGGAADANLDLFYIVYPSGNGITFTGLDCLFGDCNVNDVVSVSEVVRQVAVHFDDGTNGEPAGCPSQILNKNVMFGAPTPEPLATPNPYYVSPNLAARNAKYGYNNNPGVTPRPTLTATITSTPAATATRTPTRTRRPTQPPTPTPVQQPCMNGLINPLCACHGTNVGASVNVRSDLVSHVTQVKAVSGIDGGICFLNHQGTGSTLWVMPVGCTSGSQDFRSYGGVGCPPDNHYGIDIHVTFDNQGECVTTALGLVDKCGCMADASLNCGP